MAVPLAQLTQTRPTFSLHREIATAWHGSPAAVPSARPLRPLGRVEAGHPTESTSFVGREQALIDLRRLLDERRLLTLIGPGGVGKTRLARRLAVECAARFSAVWTVDLGALTEAALLPVALASAIGMVQTIDRRPLDTLIEAIGGRRALLVLDNCEHLIDACANLAGDLLVACPGLRILATSREPLVAPGELAWPVPPLSLPSREVGESGSRGETPFLPDSPTSRLPDSVRLFLDRAATARPAFALTADNAGAIAAICRRLDGLPLAIELAAARVRHLTPHQIADQLDHSFRAIAGGGRPPLRSQAPSRHRTLRATIAWSDDLLDPSDRALLRRLAVFAGGFSLEGAQGALGAQGAQETDDSSCAPCAPSVQRLVDAALVTVEQIGGARRYGLLETVRAFALERLRMEAAGLESSVRRAHAVFFRRQAEDLAPLLLGPSRAEALDRLAVERDNLRVALATSLDADRLDGHADGLRLAAALWWFWFHRGEWSEGRTWLDRALSHPGVCTEPDGPTPAQATALCGAGWLAFAQGDVATARRRLTASIAAFRQRRDGRGVALAAGFLSQALLSAGDLVDARRLAGEAVALARSAGADWDLALARLNLGNVERVRGNDLAAGRLFEEGVVAARAAGDRWLEAMGLRNLGIVAARTGKSGRGVTLLRESLALSYRTGERWFVTRGLEDLATLAVIDGNPARAACLLGAAESLRATAGTPAQPFHRADDELAMNAVRRSLPAHAVAGHWAAGRAMSLAEAVAFALNEPVALPTEAAVAAEPRLETRRAPAAEAPGPVVLLARARDTMERHLEVPTLRIAALGSGRVELGGRQLSAADWTYAKPRELLFYLLDHPDRTKEQVGSALWPEASAEQLRGSFHVALHHLRRVLGEAGWVRYADRRYAVNRDREIVYDVAIFEERLAAVRRPGLDRERAIAELEEVIALYAGDYLEDHVGAWIETRRDGLRRAHVDALLLLGETRLVIGRPTDAESTFRRLLADDELHEAGHRGLIRALARQGQPGQALRHLESLVELLRAELDTVPAAETAALAAALHRGEAI